MVIEALAWRIFTQPLCASPGTGGPSQAERCDGSGAMPTGRGQRVGKRHRAKSQFADKPFIVVLLLRGAIDLQIDLTNGVLASLPALDRRQRLAVENGLYASSQLASFKAPIAPRRARVRSVARREGSPRFARDRPSRRLACPVSRCRIQRSFDVARRARARLVERADPSSGAKLRAQPARYERFASRSPKGRAKCQANYRGGEAQRRRGVAHPRCRLHVDFGRHISVGTIGAANDAGLQRYFLHENDKKPCWTSTSH